MSEIKTLRHHSVYENAFVQVFDNEVQFPSGKYGTYFRYRWKSPHGVAIMPIIGSEAILIEKYRYSELSFSTEIPQGFGNEGNTPEDDALRELFEETGFKAQSLERLMVIGADFKTYVFTANIPNGQTPSSENAELSESIHSFKRVCLLNLDPVKLNELGIIDAVTIAALLAVAIKLK
jgi:8-oxo-dGTP pyrophosphatase MutT (NUDIX family)